MARWWTRMNEEMARRGLTQADLSRAARIEKHNVKQYCAGNVENPRGDTIARIAQALGVSPAWLEYGIDPSAAAPKAKPDTPFAKPGPPRGLFESREVYMAEPRDGAARLAFLFPGRRGLHWWTVATNALDRAGILPGDTIVTDPAAHPSPGQPVIAQVVDNVRGSADTVLRRWYPGMLDPASSSTGHASIAIVDSPERTVAPIQPVIHVQRDY